MSHTHLQRDKVTQTPPNDPTGMEQEASGQPDCNQGGCASNRPRVWLIVSICVLMWCAVVRSVDHSPGGCRVSLHEAGAAAGRHEEAPGQSGQHWFLWCPQNVCREWLWEGRWLGF